MIEAAESRPVQTIINWLMIKATTANHIPRCDTVQVHAAWVQPSSSALLGVVVSEPQLLLFVACAACKLNLWSSFADWEMVPTRHTTDAYGDGDEDGRRRLEITKASSTCATYHHTWLALCWLLKLLLHGVAAISVQSCCVMSSFHKVLVCVVRCACASVRACRSHFHNTVRHQKQPARISQSLVAQKVWAGTVLSNCHYAGKTALAPKTQHPPAAELQVMTHPLDG